jgi:hypothetical protein
LIAPHVDEQLTEEEAALAAAHLTGCPRCAHLREALLAVRQTLRQRPLIQRTPAAIRQQVLTRIDVLAYAHATRERWRNWWSRPLVRLGLAGATVALLLTITVPSLRSRLAPAPAPLFAEIADHYEAAESGQLALALRTDDPMELRAYYLASDAFTFRNTVANLEPLGLVLVGGTLSELAGQRSTLSVYHGAHGMVLCHRVQATGLALPPGGEMIGGVRFYTVGGMTICVHLEGDVICFLASTMPRSDFVRLFAGHV